VSRLLPYKNVDAIVESFSKLPHERLVVAGAGPAAAALAAMAGGNVQFLGEVDDATLRWLYQSCQGLLSASYEDFGLTPLEAAAHATPSAVLRWGGFLDTIIEGSTGVFFDEPTPDRIADAVRELGKVRWDQPSLVEHAQSFSTERFVARVRVVVAEEAALVSTAYRSQRQERPTERALLLRPVANDDVIDLDAQHDVVNPRTV
jgi:glycosyltransferase involved in cell wall biosynthesis